MPTNQTLKNGGGINFTASFPNQAPEGTQFPATLGSKTSANAFPVVLATDQAAIPVTQSGTWTIGLGSGAAVIGGVTQSGTWTVGLSAGVNAIGSITNTTFAATQSGTWNIGSITTLPSLPTGGNVIGSIANTAFGATQSGTWNIANISGTVSLPTGAATSANQATANTSLASLDTKTPALGQAAAAASSPVVLPTSQVSVLASAANQIDSSATGSITAADSASTTATPSTGQSVVTGTPTANSTVVATLSACSTAIVTITGTFTGLTAVAERSADGGATWVPASVVVEGIGSSISSITTIGKFRCNVAGQTNFRIRQTGSAPSAAVTVTIAAAKGVENVFVGNGVRSATYTSTDASGNTGTINTYAQVSAAGVNNRNFVRILNPGYKDDGSANTSVLTVGLGTSGSEYILDHLNPGDSIQYAGSDRVAVKSILTASAIYKAIVATYN